MNVMTIILSTAASLLVAALILSWQSSNSGVGQEAVDYQRKIAVLEKKIVDLERKLRSAKQSDPNGSSLSSQVSTQQIEQALATAKMNKTQAEDRLAALNQTVVPETAGADEPATVSTSALDAALGNTKPKTEQDLIDSMGDQDTGATATSANSDQRRRQVIRDSSVYANVVTVLSTPDAHIIYAELNDGFSIAEGSILAVRRNQIGIAGLVKIVQIIENGSKKVLSLEIHGNDHPDFTVTKGDELILRP